MLAMGVAADMGAALAPEAGRRSRTHAQASSCRPARLRPTNLGTTSRWAPLPAYQMRFSDQGDDELRFGGGAHVVQRDARRDLAQQETLGFHVDHCEVGDDPLDTRLTGQWQGALAHDLVPPIPGGVLHHYDHPLRPMYEVHCSAHSCLLYTSPSPRDRQKSRMPSP